MREAVGVRVTTGGGTTDRSTEELMVLVGLSPKKLASQELMVLVGPLPCQASQELMVLVVLSGFSGIPEKPLRKIFLFQTHFNLFIRFIKIVFIMIKLSNFFTKSYKNQIVFL
jgi:hypothetical protein